MHIQSSLSALLQLSVEKEEENIRFVDFLKQQDEKAVDATVHRLNRIVEKEIDCTQCGNCCKTLMINVTEDEANKVSQALEINRNDFDNKYIEKGSNGMMLISAIPCHFLHENKCTVYEHRFEGCREFPALHLPYFTKRLFTVMMHYSRCPIIFNVVEQVKIETGFHN